MFFEHLVAKSFKQFFFVIFIHVIAGDFIYAHVLLLILNENNVNGIMNCTKFAFRILEGQFRFGLTFDP